jgi:hypothetical protein
MGGVLAPAGELLAFARLHLAQGRAPDGGDLLAPADVVAMQRPHVECPVPGEEQALGWTVRRWGGMAVLGQDADTFGQRACLRVVPELGMALCVLTNSPPGGALAQQLLDHLAADLLDVATGADRPALPAGADGHPVPAPDLVGHVGVYDRLHQRLTVRIDGGVPVLATEPSGVLQALGVHDAELVMEPVTADGSVHAVTDPASGAREHAVFVAPAAGEAPTGLYVAGRLHRRVA